MTVAVSDLPRLRPGPHPIVPLGPFRQGDDGKTMRFNTAGPRVIRFIEKHCVFTNGQWIGQPFKLLDWEKQLLLDLFELVWCERHKAWCRRYRTALIGVGKKNGKTELTSALGLYFLLGDGEPAPLVSCAAAGDDQADLLFNAARTMVEMSPTLSQVVQVWEKEIVVPESPNAALKRVPASGGRLDGKNIYVSLCDELHEWMPGNQEKTHGVMRGGMAARAHPLNINITTAGYDQDTICYRLYDYGRKVESGEIADSAFFFRWWQAPEECDYRDLEMLPFANPSYGVTVQEEFYRDELGKRRESDYRRYYLNQWVEAEEMWLPAGAWEECKVPGCELVEGETTFIGWDAGTHEDSTAVLAGQWVGDKFRVKARTWERPLAPDGQPVDDWTLPIEEVEEYVQDLWRERFKVESIAYDPAFITWSARSLADEGLPMVKFPQTDGRMVEATKAAYELIIQGKVEHDGDPVLARHLRSAVSVQTRQGGQRLTKGRVRRVRNQIDAAIALVMLIVMAMRHGDSMTSRYEDEGARIVVV